jgi:asparagine synthetase B (glutamine-hydrolysing)
MMRCSLNSTACSRTACGCISGQDVPYGLFLSGGIDSAAIATLMARLNSRPVTAYTCGFEGPGAKDERAAAERVARALGLDWRETTFGEADFWRVLPEVAWALDDPTTDYATLPTWKLAEAAKGTLTVVLTGEGGDELFGGYGRYRRALRPALLGGRPAEPQIDAPFLKDRGVGTLDRWREAVRAAAIRAPKGLTRLQQAQYADIVTWLPNDLLLKLDRCLMAHGLEGRTPFLDREVAAFAFPLPDRFKVRGRHGKWILRKWLERCCPAAEPWAKSRGSPSRSPAGSPPAPPTSPAPCRSTKAWPRSAMSTPCGLCSPTTNSPSTAGRSCSTPSGGTSTSAAWHAPTPWPPCLDRARAILPRPQTRRSSPSCASC